MKLMKVRTKRPLYVASTTFNEKQAAALWKFAEGRDQKIASILRDAAMRHIQEHGEYA